MEISDYKAMRAALARMCAVLAAGNASEECLFDSKLVASELLVNALRYGGGAAAFSFAMEGEEISICVKSALPFCPPEATVCAEVASERGRGLYLVDSLVLSRRYSEEEGICVRLRIF